MLSARIGGGTQHGIHEALRALLERDRQRHRGVVNLVQRSGHGPLPSGVQYIRDLLSEDGF